MEDKLIELLESFGYPVMRQGSLGDEDYPETFFTFWNNSEGEDSSYDNDTFGVVANFDVNVYSTNPQTVYSALSSARRLLIKNGWHTPDRGHDVASDEATHIGRGMEVAFLFFETEENVNGQS